MSVQIVGQTIEAGKPAYLVSIDGEAPEPMSEEALEKAVELPQVLQWHWNPKTSKHDIPVIVTYARPDLINDRGGRICAQCGGKTRMVLDGEAWCGRCKRYQ